MPTIYLGSFAKRRNSTKQPTTELSDSRTIKLKENTSYDSPTFILTGNNLDYNYAKWDNRYYFITDTRSIHNDLMEVDCVLDPLATYKAEIIASTQFVSYSSSGTAWLADTRIPLLKDATVSSAASTMNFLFTAGGFYVLSVIGENGCQLYCADSSKIEDLISDISQWQVDLKADVLSNLPVVSPSTTEECLKNLVSVMTDTGILGNAYLDAPNCIRSCIWVPFFVGDFVDGAFRNIHLGAFDTGVSCPPCKTSPVTNSASVTIPWQHNDWRRAVCEEVYLYLPLVGMVSIPSDEVVRESQITVQWSATATDGCVAYRVMSGNQCIGTYGANCSVNYPIGISQQASAGQIVQSVMSGAQQTVSGAIQGAANGAAAGPWGVVAGGAAGAAMNGIVAAYDIADVALTRHNSCIGGIGGGAGVGLSLDLLCFTVSHECSIAPASMAATMGLPTMKPMSLSGLSGYCQCANAHVECAAQANELDAIDSYLNSGFFIE